MIILSLTDSADEYTRPNECPVSVETIVGKRPSGRSVVIGARNTSAMLSCVDEETSRVSCELGRTKLAPDRKSDWILYMEGGPEASTRTYIADLEKNWDTEEMRSRSISGVLSRTPDTPFRTLSDTALTLTASSRSTSLSCGMRPMTSLAEANGSTSFSAPWSSQATI